jgi:predicted negative regulator of RcsB-dependent stress response
MKTRAILTSLVLALSLAATRAQPAPTYDALIQQGKNQLQSGNSAQALTSGQQAVQLDAARWEAYALAGGALMNLKRYDEAIDNFSKSIDHAPAEKQDGLRNLRKQCFVAETGATPAPAQPSASAQPQPAATTQAEIVLWKAIENSQKQEDFRVYLGQYPSGAFAALAKQRLADLQAQQQKVDEGRVARYAWVDPTNGLMWQRPLQQDEGGQMNFDDATDTCSNSKLLHLQNWRLPTADEVEGVWQRNRRVFLDRVYQKKKPTPSWGLWTSTAGDSTGEHIVINLDNGNRLSMKDTSMKDTKGGSGGGYPGGHRGAAASGPVTVNALCVRDSNGAAPH